MQIVRYGTLKQKLRDRSLTDREALPYLVLICVMTTLLMSFPLFEEFNKWDIFSGIASAVLAFCSARSFSESSIESRSSFSLISAGITNGSMPICLSNVFLCGEADARITMDIRS